MRTTSTEKYSGYDKVNDHMYVGGDPVYCEDEDEVVAFINRSVDVVIDCRSIDERHGGWDELVDVPVIYAPMHDDGRQKNHPEDFIGPYFQLQELIGTELLPSNPVIFVHCHMGVNRGPSMAMFLLMVEHQLPAQQAFELLRESRMGIGLSYSREAVRAYHELQDSADEIVYEAGQHWEAFLNSYWSPSRVRGVNTRIRRNRDRFTGVNYAKDDTGMLHGVRKGQG